MTIEIRHSEATDLEAIRAIYAQPSNMAATLQLPWPSIERWQARLGKVGEHVYSLVACENGAVLGQIGIEVMSSPRRKHVAHLGMGVSEHARRRGVGSALLTAALTLCHQWLAVRRVELETYTDNAAAIALYLRHGFVHEGIARGYAFRDGRYVDVCRMAHLQPD